MWGRNSENNKKARDKVKNHTAEDGIMKNGRRNIKIQERSRVVQGT